MLDIALVGECLDPSLSPAVVEQFIQSAGSPDPLAVTVKSGNRLILVPKPKSVDEAMAIIRQNIPRAVVRVGLTQLPAGLGVRDAPELTADIVDACGNLRMGTAIFAKVMRIVAKWYGNPTAPSVQPQILEDAIYSWKTGEFEGVNVFGADDPGEGGAAGKSGDENRIGDNPSPERVSGGWKPDDGQGSASIRIDLSRITGSARAR